VTIKNPSWAASFWHEKDEASTLLRVRQLLHELYWTECGAAQRGEILTAAQTAAARNFVNEISGSRRMLCHGLLYVGKGNLAYIQEQIDQNKPDSWKGYNISNSAKVDNDPSSLMRQWRHDDAEVAYPTFELIQKNYERLKSRKPGFNYLSCRK
jgi:hypothetical protein